MVKSTKGSADGPDKPARKKAPPRKTTSSAKVTGRKPSATTKAKAPAAAKRKSPPATRRALLKKALPPAAPVGLSEEEAIRSAKYLPRELPRRFEEERFVFPRSYGVDRVRLVVKDPEWLFAYWDLSPDTLAKLKREIGDRTFALSRLTLRISDPVNGGTSDVLLAEGARSWYVRADDTPRTYKAELGMTLPSGAFRRLAESNVVTPPRVGPSPERAKRRISYPQAKEIPAAAARRPAAPPAAAGPWQAPSVDATRPAPSVTRPRGGGASDAFPPGGASDAFRK